MKAGIISDTHLVDITPEFRMVCEKNFADCDVIIHAGDITNMAILDVFAPKTVHAVHGNMCHGAARKLLPEKKEFKLGQFNFGLIHGNQCGMDIEESLWHIFPEADCVIYGHTHRAVCHIQGGRLVINPGAFKASGRFGAGPTYAVVDINEQLSGKIIQVNGNEL